MSASCDTLGDIHSLDPACQAPRAWPPMVISFPRVFPGFRLCGVAHLLCFPDFPAASVEFPGGRVVFPERLNFVVWLSFVALSLSSTASGLNLSRECLVEPQTARWHDVGGYVSALQICVVDQASFSGVIG